MDRPIMTGEQIRAARALLRITQKDLASEARLSLETIKRLENIRGEVDANLKTVKSVRSAFFRLGAVFEVYSGIDTVVGIRPQDQSRSDYEERRLDVAPRPPPFRRPNRYPKSDGLLHRLTYFSTAVSGDGELSPDVIKQIAEVSAYRNAKQGVTGALLSCGQYFLQTLEGSLNEVSDVYRRIGRDDRHAGLNVLQSKTVSTRVFRGWNMLVGTLSVIDEIIVDDLNMKDGFNPALLTPAGALGLLVLATFSHQDVISEDTNHSSPGVSLSE